MTEEVVVLVDEQDQELGTGEKMAVHRSGQLHRAFSIFIVDAEGHLILQRRAAGKYHSAGLWSNTCCGHPRPGETILAAARRRLKEEMGFDCPLHPAFAFTYRAALDHGLTEHELDHVLTGSYEGTPRPNPEEVDEWRAAPMGRLVADLSAHPGHYSVWLKPALDGLLSRGLLTLGEEGKGGTP
jgi:isopentenyl-diphosphate delta-isomerase